VKPIKFGAIVMAFDEEDFLPGVLTRLEKSIPKENIKGIIGAPYVTGNWTTKQIPKIFKKHKIETYEISNMMEHDRRNEALKRLNCDYTFIVDADEFWIPEKMQGIMNFISRLGEVKVSTLKSPFYTYWKTPEWRIDPIEPSRHTVLVKKGTWFVNNRETNNSVICTWGEPTFHHFSYVGDDVRIRRKMLHCSSQYVTGHTFIPDWFENVWQAWTPDMTFLHPVTPSDYYQAVKVEPIEEFREKKKK